MDTTTSGTDGAGYHLSLRTTCGREIRMGHLALGDSRHVNGYHLDAGPREPA
jgi:hypothetical protein